MARYADSARQELFIERLRKSHEKYKGANNPANRPDVKEKIRNNPNSQKGRFKKDTHPHNYEKTAKTYEPTRKDAEKRRGQKRTPEQRQTMRAGLPANHGDVARERAINNMLRGRWGKDSKHENKLEQILIKKLEFVKDKDYFHPYRVSNYVFDFYIPSANLIVETDGREHKYDREVKHIDIKKEKLLRERGYFLLRLSDTEIFSNPESVLIKLAGMIFIG